MPMVTANFFVPVLQRRGDRGAEINGALVNPEKSEQQIAVRKKRFNMMVSAAVVSRGAVPLNHE